MKYISFDIDGIMNDYPKCWLRYLNDKINMNLSLDLSTKEVKEIVKIELYNKIKVEYRNSDYKANLPFNNGSRLLANDFIEEGYKIIVSTARPLNNPKYKTLKQNTIDWLKKNNFRFDLLVDKNEELKRLGLYNQIALHIEDEIKYAIQFEKYNIPTLLLTSEKFQDTNLIKKVETLEDIRNIWRRYV